MTLRLIIMRHAKSDWNSTAQTDHERPLNERGRLAAPLVARELLRRRWAPDIVRSSDSVRTRETFARMQPELPPIGDVEFTADLYHAGHHALSRILRRVPTELTTLLALGHNPGWQHAVEYFSGESVEFTTANAAQLEFDVDDWAEAATCRGCWQLIDVIRPRDLALGSIDLE